NHPDTITVSPRGGILLCEDGGGISDQFGPGNRLMGLLPSGECYVFAKNNLLLFDRDLRRAGKRVQAGDYRSRELCGACFDPAGVILFVNVQTPGITFAITRPWDRGPLWRPRSSDSGHARRANIKGHIRCAPWILASARPCPLVLAEQHVRQPQRDERD